jgi:glutamate carboxypeptidase
MKTRSKRAESGRSTPGTGARLLEFLRGRRDAMIDLLRALVEAETPSLDSAAQFRVQRLLAAALEERGCHVRIHRGRSSGGCLRAVPAARRVAPPIQLLLGHGDTVWPAGTLRRMPVELREGRLYGPGAFDMKGGLVQAVFALEAVQLLGLEPPLPPILLVNSDEEIGSADSTARIRRLARNAERVFVLEPALGPRGDLKTARKGVGRYQVRVVGRAAHAGLDPERGASAILELSHVIQAIFALNDPRRGVAVNVGTIAGGVAANVIASEAGAAVDVRVIHDEDASRIDRIMHGLRARTPGTSVFVEGGMTRPPLERTAGNRHLWTLAREAAAELGLEIGEATAGGASDGNTTSQYAPTLDGLGAVGDGAHAHDEHVVVDRMPERAALLARLLLAPRLGAEAPDAPRAATST